MANHKMRKCSGCGNEISAKGKVVCPHCGKVHKGSKTWLIALVVGVLLIGVAGSMGDDEPEVVSDTSTTKASENEVETIESENITETEEPERTEFFIGEFVNLKDIVVRVLGVSDYTESNTYLQPDEGFVRKAVEVEIFNIGTSDYDLQSLFSFEIRDSAGYAYTPNWYDTLNEVLSGSIPVGGKSRGYVFFDVPENETITSLLYDYALYSSGQITFNLDASKTVADVAYTNPAKLNTVQLGTEVKDTSLIVTVNSVKQANLSSLDAMSIEGYKYLIADVMVKNISNSNVYNSAYGMFYAVDTDGFRYKLSIYAEGLRGTIDGDLAPGKDARAEIAFIVKNGVTIDYIVYSDILGLDTLPVFDLNEIIN